MRLSLVLIPLTISVSEAFSMLSPRGFFPQRFTKYLQDIDEMFEMDWPSTFMEKQLQEFKDMLPSTEKSSGEMTTFKRASPRYEVIDDHERFEVKLDVPGFKPDEIEVGLKAGGRILTITGYHEAKEEGRQFQSQFQQNFSLDPSILTDELSANFQGDRLIVSAPRKAERLPESRKIPIKMIAGGGKESGETEGKAKKGGTKEEGVKP
jgi:HSP20 family molecular chaperone IbpA